MAANNPFEGGISSKELRDVYRGIESSVRETNRQIRQAGASVAGVEQSRKEFDRHLSDLERQTRARTVGVTSAAATGTSGYRAGGATGDPRVPSHISEPLQRSRTQVPALIATEANQTKKLDKAKSDLAKTEQRLVGLRTSRGGASSGERTAIDKEIQDTQRAQQRATQRVTERTAVLGAVQQRLTAEQSVLATLEAQAATLVRIVALSERAARASFMANRAIAAGPGTALQQQGPLGTIGGGRPIPFAVPWQQHIQPPQPPRLPPPMAPRGYLEPPRTPFQLPQYASQASGRVGSAPLGGGPTTGGPYRMGAAPPPPRGAMDPGAVRQSSAGLRELNDDMRRYGALSTEFIDKTRRGAVSLREIGWQLGATTSKFGGWLAAGGLIYGGIGAARSVGTGVIESQSGVQQLQRVMEDIEPERAAQGFRDLSDTFNVPIKDAADATFEMGKAFRDQEDALTASEAVLGAVKIGELELGDASTYLTSIIHGFNLEASDMNTLLDQINAAQNKFGIQIESTTSGLARAAGVMRASGGDLTTTLALIGTGSRVTGQSGNVVGTALSRTPNFLRKPSNQAFLRGFGVDPEADIDQVFEQAFQSLRGRSGQDIQEVAAAIMGPRYGARIGTPLLQNEDLFRRFQREVSPERARGSAQEELQSVLGESREQLQEITNELERLGSVLQDIGAFDAFALGLTTLNQVLSTVREIAELFNSLPDPLKQSVVYFGQIASAIALMRKFNLGPSIAAGAPGGGEATGFRGAMAGLFTREGQAQHMMVEGLIEDENILAEEHRRAAQAQVRKSFELEAAQGQLAQEAENRAAAMRAGTWTDIDEQGYQGRLGRVQSAQQGLADTAYRSNMARDLRIRNAAMQQALGEQRLSPAHAEAVKQQMGLTEASTEQMNINALAEVDEQVGETLEQYTQEARDVVNRTAPVTESTTRPLRQRFTDMRRAIRDTSIFGRSIGGSDQAVPLSQRLGGSSFVSNMRTRMEGFRRAITETSMFGRSFGEAQGQIIPVSQRLNNTLKRVSASRLGTVGRGLAQGLRAFGTGIMQLINPMTSVIAAIGIIMYGWQQAKQRQQELEQAMATVPGSMEEFREADVQLSDAAAQPYSALEKIFMGAEQQRFAAREIRSARDATRAEQVYQLRENQGSVILSAEEAARRADEHIQRLVDQGKLPEWGADEGLRENLEAEYGRAYLFEDDIERRIAQISRATRSAQGTVEQRQVAIERLIRVISQTELDEEVQRSLATAARLTPLQGPTGGLTLDILSELKGDPLSQQIQEYGEAISTGLADVEVSNKLITSAAGQAMLLLHSNQPEHITQAGEAIQALAGPIQEIAREELDRALLFASSQDRINQAYSEYFEVVSGGREFGRIRGLMRQQRQQLRRKTRERELLLEDDYSTVLEDLPDAVRRPRGILRALDRLGDRDEFMTDQREALKENADRRRTLARQIRNGREAIEQLQEELQEQRRQAREEQFQANQSLRQARGSYRETQVGAGVPQLEASLRAVRLQIRAALNLYARDSEEVLNLLAEEQNIINSLVQEQMSLMEANQRYEAARFTGAEDPVPGLQNQLSDLRERLAFMQAHPRVYSQVDIREAEAEIRETEVEIRRALEDRAEEAADTAQAIQAALSDVRTARFEARGNEVGAAREGLRQARREFRQAEEPEERIQARAAAIRARAQLRDSIFQREIEDISFAADIGELTLQQQINQYQQLLKTMNITRDQRRDLRRRIHQLKEEADQATGEFDLQVGDIQLPTVYEIRRAIQGGADQGSRVTINQTNHYVAQGVNTNELMSEWSRSQEDTHRRSRNLARSAGIT